VTGTGQVRYFLIAHIGSYRRQKASFISVIRRSMSSAADTARERGAPWPANRCQLNPSMQHHVISWSTNTSPEEPICSANAAKT
jgi:hypothetical protein